jgi:hypothetical protein
MGINSKLGRLSIVAAETVLSIFLSAGARAADPGFCHDYAGAAVRQAETAWSIPRCRPGMGGARWATEFHVHYDWCLGASYEAANIERDIRRRHIDACR